MSEHTPITGELRNGGWRLLSTVVGDEQYVQKFDADKFDQLCDAIDAIHANLERENDRLCCKLDRMQGEQRVRLPKDADGETVCADDDVEWLNGISHGRVTGIGVGEYYGWVWVLPEGKNVSIAMLASDLRHCHPDTWESIIYDAMQAGRTDTTVDVTPLIKRCKALCERTKGGDAE